MQTLKIPIKINNQLDIDLIRKYQTQYSSCLHLFYNQIKDTGLTEHQSKSVSFNNIELMDAWFTLSCYKEAKQIFDKNKDKKVIFGGKKNFFNRLNGLITKEEFQEKRLSSIYSIGDKNSHSNRKFKIVDEKHITFKPCMGSRVELELKLNSRNWLGIIKRLKRLQELNEISISYKLDTQYIYIMFDETRLKQVDYESKKNRIFSIDLNPNYIGYSVTEWSSEDSYNLIDNGVITLKDLNDGEKKSKNKQTYFSNRRNFEVFEISKKLIGIAKSYQCELFGIEKLNIKGMSLGKGRKLNRLINNQWNRNKLQQNIEKRCNLIGIKYVEILPQYSSFIGNLVYRDTKLPDMILSSIEIGRRAYEFNLQYLKKVKTKKENIIFPELTNKIKEDIQKSLEELEIVFCWKTLKELYDYLKNSKCRYRVSFEDNSRVFSGFRYRNIRNFNAS